MSDFLPNPQPAAQPPQEPADMNGLANQWRDWINQPDNRAALMQFGVAMLQPMGMGESILTHGANAIGEGGEAAGRVHETEAKRAGEASLADYRDRTAGAREDTAGARVLSAENRGGVTATASFTAKMRQDAAFRKWASSPEDLTGGDPIVKALGAKSKGEIIADPVLRDKARKLYKEIGEGGDGGAAQLETETPQVATTDQGGGATLDQRRAAPAQSFGAMMQRPEVKTRVDVLKQRLRAQDPEAKVDYQRLRAVVADPEALDAYIAR